MAVNLSPAGGVAAQFFDNNGNPLTGGKLFSYAAGTTTPYATYTTSAGNTAHTNPIILDAAGRVPGGEIWLTDGLAYKFVLKTSTDVTIATYDNVTGINAAGTTNYVIQQEFQTATAGQTVFNLTTLQYAPGTNGISVFVDGVNQYGPGASYQYVETNSTTITFNSGLSAGQKVKFSTATVINPFLGDASQVSYTGNGANAVATSVQSRLREMVLVTDYGAVGDGVTDDTAAMQAAHNTGKLVYYPKGFYKFSSITMTSGGIVGEGPAETWLQTNSATGNAITATNSGLGFVFRDFQMQPSVTRSSGAELLLTVPNTATDVTTGTLLDNVLFYQQIYDALYCRNQVFLKVVNCQFLNYSNTAITFKNSVNPDGGDNLVAMCTFNTARPSGNRYGVYINSGGGCRLLSNKFLGGNNSITVDIDHNSNMADLFIQGNSIENYTYAGIVLGRQAGNTGQLGGIWIMGNNFAGEPGNQYALFSSTSGAFIGMMLNDNTFYSMSSNVILVGINGINEFTISNNLFDTAGGTSNVQGLYIDSGCTKGNVYGNWYSSRLSTAFTNLSSSVMTRGIQQRGSGSAATSASYGSLYTGSTSVTFSKAYDAAPTVVISLKDASGSGGVSAFVSSVSTTGFTANVVGVTNSSTLNFAWIAEGEMEF